MSKTKKKAKARRREYYVTIRGKRVKTTARAARIFRLAKQGLEGLDIPPP